MGDVLQYLIDGTSGIVTGGVDGKALVAGVCSRGIVGKAYLIGKRTDLAAMLGTGPLVDRVRDMLTTGGQAPYVVAVPVQGQPGTVARPEPPSPVIRRSMPMWWSRWPRRAPSAPPRWKSARTAAKHLLNPSPPPRRIPSAPGRNPRELP